ncbi:MAG: glycosyltransferase family 39 protein [Acidobacteriales bacterium]|nr:glycosyltransferase family 39 protein [Terriglobales bacterium]
MSSEINRRVSPVTTLPGEEPTFPSSIGFATPRNTNRIAATLIAAGAVLRIFSYFCSDNSGGDAWARIALTANWLKHPRFQVIFEDYPPGHFWLIGLYNLLVHNVTIAGRSLSLILGILSLYAFWKLAQYLYGDDAALLSLTAFSFYSLHIGYSSTSSAEATYLFFVLAGLAFFFGAMREGASRVLLLAFAGLSLSAAETMRLEAWIICFGLGVGLLVLLWKSNREPFESRTNISSIIVFGITGGGAPAFLMLYCWRMFGDPMRLMTLHNVNVIEYLRDQHVSLAHQLMVTPLALLLALSPLVLIGAVYGWFKSLRSWSTAIFAVLVLFFTLIQQWEVIRGRLLAMPRYSLTTGAMLAIISGYGVLQLLATFSRQRQRVFLGIVVASIVLNTFFVLAASEIPNPVTDKFASISPRLRYATRISQVGNYLKTQMQANDAVIIDNYNDEPNIIAAAAGFPVLAGDRVYFERAGDPLTPPEYVALKHPRFLIFSDRGTIHKWLPLPPDRGEADIFGAHYRCVFSNDTYRIYEIRYP